MAMQATTQIAPLCTPKCTAPMPIDEPTQISKACGKPQAPHTNVDPMVVSEQHGKAL